MTHSDTHVDSVSPRVTVAGREGGTVRVRLGGEWKLEGGLERNGLDTILAQAGAVPDRIALDGSGLSEWDTSLLTFVSGLADGCRERGIELDTAGLPEAARQLLDLATRPADAEDESRELAGTPFVARVGESVIGRARTSVEILEFIGEVALAFFRLPLGRVRFRGSDLFLFIQQSGAEALPIVTLISFLVGAILAFVGAVQLDQFGAQIFVADLVAIGMTREMGALMTAIIMGGRTGTAYAANLGTMVVNEEIDALRTTGISPIDFLVVPRVLALILMMPLLCLYADLLGILGGATVGLTMLDLSVAQYVEQSITAIDMQDIAAGVIKAASFGIVVAVAGCLRGMQSGRDAAAVGDAATRAAVSSILFIVIVDAVLTVIYSQTGF